jgi:hypothetical protein
VFGRFPSVDALVERGLVASRSMPIFATAPDAVAVVSLPRSPWRVDRLTTDASSEYYYSVCIIEVKTVHGALEQSKSALAGTLRGDRYRSSTTAPPCAALTIGNERHARDREGNDDFSRHVPDMSHHQQLIHHASAYSCRHVLYVVSSTTTVSYCVLAKFSDALISGQQAAICDLYDPHLMYALPATSAADRRQPVPTDLTRAEYGYTKDASGMALAFPIRDGLIGVALRADAPLPVISSARLSGCYVWSNRERTPTDSDSRKCVLLWPAAEDSRLNPDRSLGNVAIHDNAASSFVVIQGDTVGFAI